MYGDGKNDEQLRASWHQFCDELKEAGELVFRDTAPHNTVTRATGIRLLARNIALGLQFELENKDPEHPELLHYFDPLRKQGGDNTDALYVGAPVNGVDTYRISGQRGSAAYFAVTVLEDGDTPWGGGVIGTLIDEQIAVADDGSFELLLSPDEQPGNWIKTSPDTYRLTVRQFFSDWENEEPMVAVIERLGHAEPPAPLTADTLQSGLRAAAHWVSWSTTYWADMIDKWKARPNEFINYGELESNKIDFTPGGAPLISYWQVPADEALIVTVTPPNAAYWAVEFGNYWWETMDYRYRLCSINQHHAVLEDDGSLIVIISHEDPGFPNWLDPSGHDEGYVTFRWIGADAYPRPDCKQVKLKDLQRSLPENAQRISAEDRAAALRGRRLGVIKRFGS